MKTLLTAIKARLQTDLTYIRDGDIFITPNLNIVPAGSRPPCIGLKDGPIRRVELAGSMMGYIMSVKIAIFVQLLKPEAAIIGDAATSKKGVLEITDDVHESLDENLLSISGMQSAVAAPNEPESDYFGDEKDGISRKILTYEYEKEEMRP